MPPVSHRLFVSMDDKGHLAVVCNYAAPLLNEALSGHIMALTLCLRLVFAGRITGSDAGAAQIWHWLLGDRKG